MALSSGNFTERCDLWRLVRSVPNVERECTLSALAVDSALLSPDAFWLMAIMFMLITVMGIFVGEVGAEVD